VVYIENRDGNTHVKMEQAKALEKAYKTVEAGGLKIYRSRMDAGSYSQDVIKVMAAHSVYFYIHANRCESLTERVRQIKEWETVVINDKEYQVATLKFTQFFEERNYRLVVMHEKSDNPQLDLFTGDNFIYHSILTNDHESSEKEVIEYYNQRGASEKNGDVMNNDFGWNHLPCSDMKYNTVYLIMTAMLKNFYLYILPKISKVFENIPPTTRLKRFIPRTSYLLRTSYVVQVCPLGTQYKYSGLYVLPEDGFIKTAFENSDSTLTVHTKDLPPDDQPNSSLSNARQ